MDATERAIVAWASTTSLIGRVHLFGSRVRADNREDSDLDVAIELDLSCAEAPDLGDGNSTWIHECKHWQRKLQLLSSLRIDLAQYRGPVGTKVIHQALERSSRVIYTKPGYKPIGK